MLMEDKSKSKSKGPGMDWAQARRWALERKARREADPWGVGGDTNGVAAGTRGA